MDYTIIQPNAELRAGARSQLKGVWGKMAFTFFVYGLIYLPYYVVSACNSLNEQIPAIPPFTGIYVLLSIAAFLAGGPFAMGFVGYFLRRLRGQEIRLSNIFDGFKRFLPCFLLYLLSNLFIFLWSLLLIVPGIIKALGYSMMFYIMHDNPEIKPLEAIKKSQIMMKGYKGKYFLLSLSFIGWFLLGVLTLGIGYLWLYPYMSLSFANFYENLKQSQEKAAAAAPAPAVPA